MLIANPMYDVVFKYLVEDLESARLLIGGITGMQVLELSPRPQEQTLQLEAHFLTVLRFDFSARVLTPEGERVVIVEVQKAKLPTDILRFRRYLALQYSEEANTRLRTDGRLGGTGIPIVSLYFLGYPLEHTRAPVIKVGRTYTDLTTGRLIEEREDFIESLTHDSYVVQVACLGGERRSDVERLLAVFDQTETREDRHILVLDESTYPEHYRPLVRRLSKAAAELAMRRTMDAEDEILRELQEMERDIAAQSKVLAEKTRMMAEQDRMMAEQDRMLAEQDRMLAEQDRMMAEKTRALAEKDQSLAEKDRLIAELTSALQRKEPYSNREL